MVSAKCTHQNTSSAYVIMDTTILVGSIVFITGGILLLGRLKTRNHLGHLGIDRIILKCIRKEVIYMLL
jgi:hypothetical protein